MKTLQFLLVFSLLSIQHLTAQQNNQNVFDHTLIFKDAYDQADHSEPSFEFK